MATEYCNTQTVTNIVETNNAENNYSNTQEEHIEPSVNNDINSKQLRELDEHKNLMIEFKKSFTTNYDIIKHQSLDDRVSTNINRKVSDVVLLAIDDVMKEHLKKINQIDYWEINVAIYTAAITVKHHLGDVIQETTTRHALKGPPKWLQNLEESIINTRKLIGKLSTITNCKKLNVFTRNQYRLKLLFERKFGNTRIRTLEFKLSMLKQKLKASCEKLRYQNRLHQRKIINRQFVNNQKKVFRQMRGNNIKVTNMPSKEQVETFWNGIWNKQANFNSDGEWLNNLERNYCQNATSKNYNIDQKILTNTIKKLPLKKSPGKDMIIGYWYKKLRSYVPHLTTLFACSLNEEIGIPPGLEEQKLFCLQRTK